MTELKTSENPWLDESFNKNTVLSEALGFNIEDIVERLGIGSGDPISDFLRGNTFLKLSDTPEDYGQVDQFARTDGMGEITWDWPYWVKTGSTISYTKGKVGVKTPRPIADLDVRGSLASRDLTEGSVPFIKANSIFTDANDKFYWHDASKQLNVGDYDISVLDDFEDDFADGSIGASWTTHNTDANRTIVEAGTTLTITTAASTDGRWTTNINEAPKLYQPAPSPPFEFIAKLTAYNMPTNNVAYGIFIGHYDADNQNQKNAYKFVKQRAGDGSKYITVNRLHSQGGSESGSENYSAMDEDAILWFKITVDISKDVRFYVSDDAGESYHQMEKDGNPYAWSGFFELDMEIGFFLEGDVGTETVATFSGTTIEQVASDSIIAESFKLTDTNQSDLLIIRWDEGDTVGRILNLKVEGGDRTLDLYENFKVGNGQDVIITAIGQANTFTMNESFIIGDGNSGTLTYSASGKTLIVEDDAIVNQDLTTDADVTFGALTLDGNLIIPDAGTIGSVTTPGAITISSDGGITMSADLQVTSACDAAAFRDISDVSYYLDPASTGIAMSLAGHFRVDNNKEFRTKDSGGTDRTIFYVDDSDNCNVGWSGAGPVRFIGGGSYAEMMRLDVTDNIGINQATFGTNMVSGVAMGTGTPPNDSPADCFQMYSADVGGVADEAGVHFRDELGLLTILGGGGAVLDKTSGKGIRIDTAAPTFGWRDLLGDIFVKTVGANDPDYNDYASTGIHRYQFKNTAVTEAFNDFHISHDYVPGTEVHIHIHWSQTAIDTGGAEGVPGVAKWYFDANYSKGHDRGAFPAGVTTVSVTQTASGTIRKHLIAEVQLSTSGQIGGQDLEPDGILTVRTYRDSSDEADTLDERPWVHHVDVHYQSTNIATKQKAPDFYV